MRADELRDLARRAANVTGYRQILVLGSQAVHGALPDADLPAITTMSEEADLAVVGDLSGETPHVIEASFGMGSPYHQRFGVHADAEAGLVDLETLNDRVERLPPTVAPEVCNAAHAIVHSLGRDNR